MKIKENITKNKTQEKEKKKHSVPQHLGREKMPHVPLATLCWSSLKDRPSLPPSLSFWWSRPHLRRHQHTTKGYGSCSTCCIAMTFSQRPTAFWHVSHTTQLLLLLLLLGATPRSPLSACSDALKGTASDSEIWWHWFFPLNLYVILSPRTSV